MFRENAEEKLALEKGTKEMIDWPKLIDICDQTMNSWDYDVIPAIAQNFKTKEVLMLGYVNWQALENTLKTAKATFWSTSRKKLWVKGEFSGNCLTVKEIRVNCNQNSLLYLAELKEKAGVCHVKDDGGKYYSSCFYRRILSQDEKNLFLEYV